MKTNKPTEQENNTLRAENNTLKAQVNKLNELLKYSNELSARLRAQNDKLKLSGKKGTNITTSSQAASIGPTTPAVVFTSQQAHHMSPARIRTDKVNFRSLCQSIRNLREDVARSMPQQGKELQFEGKTEYPNTHYYFDVLAETFITILGEATEKQSLETDWFFRILEECCTQLINLGRSITGLRLTPDPEAFSVLRSDIAQLDALRNMNVSLQSQIRALQVDNDELQRRLTSSDVVTLKSELLVTQSKLQDALHRCERLEVERYALMAHNQSLIENSLQENKGNATATTPLQTIADNSDLQRPPTISETEQVHRQIELEAAKAIEMLRYRVNSLSAENAELRQRLEDSATVDKLTRELSSERHRQDNLKNEAERVKSKLHEIMHGLQSSKSLLEDQEEELRACKEREAAQSLNINHLQKEMQMTDDNLRSARMQLENVRRIACLMVGHEVEATEAVGVLRQEFVVMRRKADAENIIQAVRQLVREVLGVELDTVEAVDALRDYIFQMSQHVRDVQSIAQLMTHNPIEPSGAVHLFLQLVEERRVPDVVTTAPSIPRSLWDTTSTPSVEPRNVTCESPVMKTRESAQNIVFAITSLVRDVTGMDLTSLESVKAFEVYLRSKESQVSTLSQANASIHAQLQETTKKLEHCQQEFHALTVQEAKVSTQLQEVTRNFEAFKISAEEQASLATMENNVLQQTCNKQSGFLRETEEENNRLRILVEKLRSEITLLETKSAGSHDLSAVHDHIVAGLRDSLKAVRKDLTTLETELALARQDRDDMEAELEKSQFVYEQAHMECEELRNSVRSLSADVARLQGVTSNDHLYRKIEELENMVAELKGRNEEYERRSNQVFSELSTTPQQFNQSHNPNLSVASIAVMTEDLCTVMDVVSLQGGIVDVIPRSSFVKVSMERDSLLLRIKQLESELEDGRQLMLNLIQ